jgi:ankyrin repeat protein
LNESCERTPLLVAIAQRCKDAALTLIEAGADCELADEFQITPMLEAVETLGMEHRVVVALLRAGADDHGLIFISEQ